MFLFLATSRIKDGIEPVKRLFSQKRRGYDYNRQVLRSEPTKYKSNVHLQQSFLPHSG